MKKYLRDEPRAEVEITFQCFAAPELFTPLFDDLPKDAQDAFSNGTLVMPCEGGGVPGEWCSSCVFGGEERG